MIVIGVLFWLAAMAAAPPTSSETCARLAKDFDRNEDIMALIHDVNVELDDANQAFVEAMRPSEENLARLEAQAGRRPPGYVGGASDRARAAASASKIKSDDETYLGNGDRITTLLLANKCSPPDHVTTWVTYSKKNPNRKSAK
jgi:hypothetical protein